MSFIPEDKLNEAAIAAIAAGELGTVEDVLGRNLRAHKPLKRLTPQQRKVLGLHLQGVSTRNIAAMCDLSQRAVGLILGDELAQQYIAEFEEQADRELKALIPRSIQTLRDVMENGDHKQKLSATDKVFRASGLYERHKAGEGSGDTAEDVIRRMLDVVDNITELSKVNAGHHVPMIDAPYEVIEGGKGKDK